MANAIIIFFISILVVGGLYFSFNFHDQERGGKGRQAQSQTGKDGIGGDQPIVKIIPPKIRIKQFIRAEDSVTIQWEDTKKKGVSGYRLYLGPDSDHLTAINVGKVCQWRLTDLKPGKLHILSVASYNASGEELNRSKSAILIP